MSAARMAAKVLVVAAVVIATRDPFLCMALAIGIATAFAARRGR